MTKEKLDDPMGLEMEIDQRVEEMVDVHVEDGVIKQEKIHKILSEVDKSVDDVDLDQEVKFEPEKETAEVARTLSQFQNMIAQAQMTGQKDITASQEILKYFQKGGYKEDVGYMIYQNIFVFEEGKKEAAIARDKKTMEQVLFGHSKVGISAPMNKK